MSNGPILITGGTGNVGYRTLVTALKAGYYVRAVIRSEYQKNEILATLSIKALNLTDELTFIIVLDLMVNSVYDEVVKGVNYIIYIASPIILKGEIKPKDYKTTLIEPAVTGIVNILKVAINSPTIKRVMITSSLVAITPGEYLFEKDAPNGIVIDHESRLPSPSSLYLTDFYAYNASKIAAF
ncbi:putative oxidoreductase [Penicillium canescens]|nr:putative oxidoreductase [Penicillium canescens]